MNEYTLVAFNDELEKISLSLAGVGKFLGSNVGGAVRGAGRFMASNPYARTLGGAAIGTGLGAGVGYLTGKEGERGKSALMGAGIGAGLGGLGGYGAPTIGRGMMAAAQPTGRMAGKAMKGLGLPKIGSISKTALTASDVGTFLTRTPYGGALTGAALGAGTGAGIGYLTGDKKDRKKRALKGAGAGAIIGGLGGAAVGAARSAPKGKLIPMSKPVEAKPISTFKAPKQVAKVKEVAEPVKRVVRRSKKPNKELLRLAEEAVGKDALRSRSEAMAQRAKAMSSRMPRADVRDRLYTR